MKLSATLRALCLFGVLSFVVGQDGDGEGDAEGDAEGGGSAMAQMADAQPVDVDSVVGARQGYEAALQYYNYAFPVTPQNCIPGGFYCGVNALGCARWTANLGAL